MRRGATRSLCLSVWKEQPQAIRFYEKEGFRIAGELVFMVGDDPKEDWLMVCELPDRRPRRLEHRTRPRSFSIFSGVSVGA